MFLTKFIGSNSFSFKQSRSFIHKVPTTQHFTLEIWVIHKIRSTSIGIHLVNIHRKNERVFDVCSNYFYIQYTIVFFFLNQFR